MNLNGVEYWYIRNAQGDIIGLHDKAGMQVVGYVYDSWGKLVSISGTMKDSVGEKNPYRYRGYRYDTETGLYYLQSRYYNAEWGRFINSDGLIGNSGKLLNHNMFAYCVNNPVNFLDPEGTVPIAIPVIVVITQLLVDIATVTIGSSMVYNNVKDIDKEESKTKIEVIPHGNSKKSKKSQHGYEIYDKYTKDVVKCGISGGKIKSDGKSYRAEKQVRKFNKDDGGDIYESRIVIFLPDRLQATLWEETHSQLLWDAGNSMKKHKRPRPWERK